MKGAQCKENPKGLGARQADRQQSQSVLGRSIPAKLIQSKKQQRG
jgi:hypothetical protein